jgi:hypothetical protein
MPQDPARRATKARWTWFAREMRKQLDAVLDQNRPQLEAAIAEGIGFTAGLKPMRLVDPPAPTPQPTNDDQDDGA